MVEKRGDDLRVSVIRVGRRVELIMSFSGIEMRMGS